MASSPSSSQLAAALAWFELTRYQPLRRMTPRQWGGQILKRVVIKESLDALPSMPDDATIREWCREGIDQNMESLLADPLSDMQFDEKITPVRPMSLREMEAISRNVNHWYPKFRQGEPDKDIALDELLGTTNNPKGHLVINLAARDNEIQFAFTEWLQERRQNFSTGATGKALRSPAILEWTRAQLIPFTDLKLWSQWTGSRLTEEAIVDLIFPGNHDTEAHVKIRATSDAYKKYMNKANALALSCGLDA